MYFRIIFFIFGTVMGSFYHVVATRIANKESLLYPPSHCPNCKHKLKWYELIPIIVSLIFVSSIITVIVSDIEYMIILDEVIMVSSALIMIIYIIGYGFTKEAAFHIYSGMGSFITMYLIKIMGDYLFKKESLGGGDIKLMFLFGLVLGYSTSIMTIFLATFIAFPVAIIMLFSNKEHMIPFGPFLSIAALILLISGINFTDIINFLIK